MSTVLFYVRVDVNKRPVIQQLNDGRGIASGYTVSLVGLSRLAPNDVTEEAVIIDGLDALEILQNFPEQIVFDSIASDVHDCSFKFYERHRPIAIHQNMNNVVLGLDAPQIGKHNNTPINSDTDLSIKTQ